MLRRTKTIWQIVVLVGALCCRCTSMSNGRYETIHVMSEPPGASARISCSGATHGAEAMTPADLRVLRKSDGCVLYVTAKDHRAVEIPLRRHEIADRVSAKSKLLHSLDGCAGDSEAAGGCVVISLAIGLPIAAAFDWIDNRNPSGALYEHKPNRPFVRFLEIETNTWQRYEANDLTSHLSILAPPLCGSVSKRRAESVNGEIFTFSTSEKDYSREAMARIVCQWPVR